VYAFYSGNRGLTLIDSLYFCRHIVLLLCHITFIDYAHFVSICILLLLVFHYLYRLSNSLLNKGFLDLHLLPPRFSHLRCTSLLADSLFDLGYLFGWQALQFVLEEQHSMILFYLTEYRKCLVSDLACPVIIELYDRLEKTLEHFYVLGLFGVGKLLQKL
jgi:hypothetical protein